MNNAFDTDNYPDQVPGELVAGNRWAWTSSDITAAYPTDSYTLKFRFSLQAEPFTDSEVTASKVDSAHVVEVSHADTGAYSDGEYTWQAVVVRDSDSEEVTVDSGYLTVEPDFGATPGDSRSWVYQTLAAIRATLKGTASKEQSSYEIGGRSIALRTPAELLELEREFSKRWESEKAEADRKAGRSTNSRVLIQMSA